LPPYKLEINHMTFFPFSNIVIVGVLFFLKVHEAIAREESSKFKAGIVSREVRRGFLLRERLLRPATVKVSTGSGKQSTSSVQETKDAVV
jgi:molecular chaperone GrpE